jgi:kinesin family protein 5
LAGSEKAGKTGSSGQTLEEAKKINKSLTTLGMVINSLTDGRSSHIPYRDSKLTRILQESLGGNSRTSLIINCSPSLFNEQESLSTLRFGIRAKSIRNMAKVNVELSTAELKTILKKAKQDVVLLETQLALMADELLVWREGDRVPEHAWIPLDPSLKKSSFGGSMSIPSTPTPGGLSLPNDDFLDREIELLDTIQQKEDKIVELEAFIKQTEFDLVQYKEKEAHFFTTQKELGNSFNNLQIELEKTIFDHTEIKITVDALKESNLELEAIVEQLKVTNGFLIG